MLWKSVSNCTQRAVDLSELGDIGLSPASRETTQTTKRSKHCTEGGGQNISSSLKIKRKHTKRFNAITTVQIKQETPNLTWPEGKGDKTRRRMASERLVIGSLDCLLPKWSDSRTVLQTDSHTSPPKHRVHSLSLTIGDNGELEPYTACRLKSGPSLIIIIIKKDWQCKDGKGRLTPYQ